MQGQLPADDDELPKHKGVRRILEQCWVREPQNRPSITACRDELVNLVEEVGEVFHPV